MKKLFISLGLALAAVVAGAQSDPGRSQLVNSIGSIDGTVTPLSTPAFTPITQTASAIAEAITPDIQALAQSLTNDPVQIFNFVHDQIKYVHYFGSLKGAELTLLERSGNDFDQCALLSALLQAAGYLPTYEFGYMKMPYDSVDHKDLHHWLALNLSDTSFTGLENYISYLQGTRGYGAPFFQFSNATPPDYNDFGFQRVWLTLNIGGTNYYLDPSFKISEPIAGMNLSTAMGLSVSNLTNAAGGVDTGYSVSALNEGSLRKALAGCNSNLLNYISNTVPNASVAQVIGGQQIISSIGQPLSTTRTFPLITDSRYPLLTWTNQPTNFMSTFSISFAGTNQTWYTPALQGQRVSLTFDTNGLAQLWQDDAMLLQTTNTGSSNTLPVVLSAAHPYGDWDISSCTPIDTGFFDRSSTNNYQRTNASYAIMYAFDASPQWLQSRQQKLDAYRMSYPDTSRQVTTETLNVMGLGWMVQTELNLEMLSQEWGQLPHHHHRFGRMGQESGHGYYVDVYLQFDSTFPNTGFASADQTAMNETFDISSYFWSAMEHGIIEQLQNTNIVAASTVKMLEIASTNSQTVYMASSSDWTTGPNVRTNLINYGSTLTTLDGLIGQGFVLLLPQNGSNHVVVGTNTWAGNGYVQLGSSGGGRSMGMIISGGYNGGYDIFPNATVNTPFVSFSGDRQPTSLDPVSVYTPPSLNADPVNMADGTFQLNGAPDLSLGQAEPRGITVSRYYSTELRNNNFAGMANGWLHNYYFSLTPVSAPQPALGTTTPQQAAPMIVATYAALNLYNNVSLNPRNWMTTALIAKWGIDQLINNAVSVSMGKDTIQFLRQPDGTFTPPAGCTMTLTQSGSSYNILQRHGNTFKFDASNRLTDIVDQYGEDLVVAYNSSNWISSITDWKNRSLTFNYSNTPSRLVSITNNAIGRGVSYGYTSNANGEIDLTSFTDAEGKTSTFSYDANHEMVASFDALSQLVVSNNFDGLGHVTNQYTQGDPNKLWQIFSSGSQTTLIDPAGDQQTYYYDSQSRQIGFKDALGNLSQTFYDGQDHVVMTVSPLNETNQFIYDANQNLLASIDPLGYSNQFFYDSSFNLTSSIDARGHTNSFGYNAKFQLLASTNAAGDSVTNTYDSGTGLRTTSKDAGGTTTYGYDTFGQLNLITYPIGFGTESFLNSTNGDVLSHTDARSFVTTFQYNLRRQLTTTTFPTNLITSVIYDAVGNVITNKDAIGFSTSYIWSPTRHLLSTSLPNIVGGVLVSTVITNIYDNRDWVAQTLDPLQNPTTNAYDLAGRLLGVTDPIHRTTSMTYDGDGRKITVTNAAMEGIIQNWDGRGQLTNVIDQMGKIVLYSFDAAGNRVFLTNRYSHYWSFQFDAANRLTNTITPTGKSNSVAYNNRGLIQSVTDQSAQPTTFLYDARGRMTNRTDNIAATTYQYDLNGNRTNVYELGKTNSWAFDAYERLISYKDAATNLIQYKYDLNGNLTNLTYPGKAPINYYYDSLNRLKSVADWAGRTTTYTYDLASRVTSITRPNGTVRSNFYDAAGQQKIIIEQAASHAPIAFFKLNWNNAGRVDYEFMAPTNRPYTPPTRTLAYDDDNRLTNFSATTITNDNNGNMIWGPVTNSTPATYGYDARNRLLNVGGVNYGYDPANNRVGLTNSAITNVFVIDPKTSQVLMRIRNGVTNYYVYGLGLIYEEDDTATTSHTLTYHFDYRGSTVALTDDNGRITDQIQYSAYGLVTARTGTNDTPFQYNGRYGVQTDPNGLIFMRNRYYNPLICRFINADPSGFSGGLNMFAYANGNPVSLIDPLGLGTKEVQFPSWVQDELFDSIGRAAGGMDYMPGVYQPTEPKFLQVPYMANTANLIQGLANGDMAQIDSAGDGLVHEGEANLLFLGLGKLLFPSAPAVTDDPPASTPVGRLGNPITVQPGANSPTTINGIDYTGHALDQMQSRGLTPSVIEDTLSRGVQTPGYDGATIYTTEQGRVIVNPNGSIKTVYPKSN